MIKKNYYFLSLIFFFILAFLFSKYLLGPRIAWIIFPLGLLFLKWLELSFLKAFLALKNYSKERITLNAKAFGIKKRTSFRKILTIKILFLSLILCVTLAYTLSNEINIFFHQVLQSFKKPEPVLKIEYSQYLDNPPQEFALNLENQTIEIDTNSYIEIKIKNLKPQEDWKVHFHLEGEKNTNFIDHLNKKWSSSALFLYSQFKTQEDFDDAEKNIQLKLSHKNKTYQAILKIKPIAKPLVTINVPLENEREVDRGKLTFFVEVHSKTPLTLVELAVRTESGYKFQKTLAELANAKELYFKSSHAELVTYGIPFLPEDTLYVKAIAKTVLSHLIGESQELSFSVKTSLQVRQDLIKKLEQIKDSLEKNFNAMTIEKISQDFQESLKLADQISKSGMLNKNITEAKSLAEKIRKKNDSFYRKTLKKVSFMLSFLKRQQKIDETGNFLARLQNFKNKIFQIQNKDEKLDEMITESGNLAETALTLKGKLKSLIHLNSFALSPAEQKTLQNLLHQDTTSTKIQEITKDLTAHNLAKAQQKSQEALENAKKYLGTTLQILQQARERALAQARKNLQDSDIFLEQSKPFAGKKESSQKIKNAKEKLENTGFLVLENEFNEALQVARENTTQALNFSEKSKKSDKQKKYTQLAQNDIEKALLALQDEENSDKELQQDQDARSFRSSLDLLTAHNVLDSSWRKKILEEISALKAQGEAEDSPMIRYLESKLR